MAASISEASKRFRYAVGAIRVPFVKVYPHKEILGKLRDLYLLHFKEISKDSYLDIQDGKPTKDVDGNWFSILPEDNFSSPIAPFVNALILDIAQYIDFRQRRVDTYKDDPHALLCMEIISWAKLILLNKDLRLEETKKLVNQWKDFVSAVRYSEIFPLHEASDTTHSLNATLTNLERLLGECVKRIDFEIKRITIADHFEHLVIEGQFLIHSGFDYIAHVLTSSEMPLNFSLLNLHLDVMSTELKAVLEKYLAGKYLSNLAYDENVRSLFYPLEMTPAVEPKIRLLTESGKSLKFLDKSDQKALASESSGLIVSNLRDKSLQQETLSDYLQFHDKCNILSNILVLIRDANFLAKSGGEILLCRLAKEELEFLLTAFLKQIENLATTANKLKETGDAVFKSISLKKELPQELTTWKVNFAKSMEISKSFKISLERAKTTCQAVWVILGNIEARQEFTKEKFVRFLQDTHSLRARLGEPIVGSSPAPVMPSSPPLPTHPSKPAIRPAAVRPSLPPPPLTLPKMTAPSILPAESSALPSALTSVPGSKKVQRREVFIEDYKELENFVFNKDHANVRKILQQGKVDVNQLTSFLKYKNWSLLALACWNEDKDTVEALLEYGANPNHIIQSFYDSSDSTPQKLSRGWLEDKVDGVEWSGHTPLTISISRGLIDIVALLLNNGAKPDFTFSSLKARPVHGLHLDETFLTPLCWAIERKHDEKNTDKKSALTKIIKNLLDHKANPNHEKTGTLHFKGMSPLCLAISHLDYSTVKELLDHGADPNHYIVHANFNFCGYTPLFMALKSPNNFDRDIVRLLVERGAITNCFLQSDDEYNGLSPLEYAKRVLKPTDVSFLSTLFKDFQPDEAEIITTTMPLMTNVLDPLPRLAKLGDRYYAVGSSSSES